MRDNAKKSFCIRQKLFFLIRTKRRESAVQQVSFLEYRSPRNAIEYGSDKNRGKGVDGHGQCAVHGRDISNGFGQAKDIDLEGPADDWFGDDVDDGAEKSGDGGRRIDA